MFILLFFCVPLASLCFYLAVVFWRHRLRRKALFLGLTAFLLLVAAIAIGLLAGAGYFFLRAEGSLQ